MKIVIENSPEVIMTFKDYSDLERNKGLLGQTLAELELIKQELLTIYEEELSKWTPKKHTREKANYP